MLRNFVVGLWVMEAYPKDHFQLRGYPGSVRTPDGMPILISGLPFDYEEYKVNEQRT